MTWAQSNASSAASKCHKHLRLLAAIKPRNEKQRDQVSIAQEVLNGTLPLDELEISNPMLLLRRG